MAGLVVDPSAILALALSDEEADYADRVLEATLRHGAAVPSIFWYELRNVLLISERRGRLTEEQAIAFLEEFSHLPIECADHPPPDGTLQIARTHGLTVYDAAYLELALRRGVALATLDKKLRLVAQTIGVTVFEEEGDLS